uniref:Tyrosine-protein phosphatase non-receptor type 20 n=1 Tax=Ciona savignyi TaxID=51511 RepID=H2YCE0_CIOSA
LDNIIHRAKDRNVYWEKSMQDNRKDSIVAKISQQVVDYYKVALTSLNSAEAKDIMGDSLNKSWLKLVSFKTAFYAAVARYYAGCSSWDQERYGEGVGYLVSALQYYEQAVKAAKSLKGDVKNQVEKALKYSSDIFNGRYNGAKKDNEFIYHERVVDAALLPDIKGASLVKALPFEPSNQMVTGPDIFAKLIPMEAHLVASSYSEEKAKLLRPIVTEQDEKDAILEQYKQSIELDPDKLIKLDDADQLDPVLIEHCASLSVDQTPITKLTSSMKELSDLYMDVETVIEETIEIIEDEELETNQVKVRMGGWGDVCGKTVDSSDEVSKIKADLEVCKDVHKEAWKINDDLSTAMKVHIANLRTVSRGLDAVRKECQLMDIADLLSEEDRGHISVMEQLCRKVREMEEQRRSLVAQLRSDLEDDDVTSTLMTRPGVEAEDLFQDELKKHDTRIGYLMQNFKAQENILDAVTEANVKYARIRKIVEEHAQKVNSKSGALLLSCTKYEKAIQRCKEGSQFFTELLGKSSALKERIVKLNENNSAARKKIMEKHEAKKAPPRPSAPKPKLPPVGTKPQPSIAATLQDLGDDIEEFNDPAFLRFLQMSGGLPAGWNKYFYFSYSGTPNIPQPAPHHLPTSMHQSMVPQPEGGSFQPAPTTFNCTILVPVHQTTNHMVKVQPNHPSPSPHQQPPQQKHQRQNQPANAPPQTHGQMQAHQHHTQQFQTPKPAPPQQPQMPSNYVQPDKMVQQPQIPSNQPQTNQMQTPQRYPSTQQNHPPQQPYPNQYSPQNIRPPPNQQQSTQYTPNQTHPGQHFPPKQQPQIQQSMAPRQNLTPNQPNQPQQNPNQRHQQPQMLKPTNQPSTPAPHPAPPTQPSHTQPYNQQGHNQRFGAPLQTQHHGQQSTNQPRPLTPTHRPTNPHTNVSLQPQTPPNQQLRSPQRYPTSQSPAVSSTPMGNPPFQQPNATRNHQNPQITNQNKPYSNQSLTQPLVPSSTSQNQTTTGPNQLTPNTMSAPLQPTSTVVRRIDEIPYKGEAELMQFKTDTEAFYRKIQSLLVKTPGSLCQLDKDWKQLSEQQEKHSRQLSTAIGRCSSYKNRFQDILPFDQSRIVLTESKDDYINASLVDGISCYSPRFIATQSPLPASCGDFWLMVHEQQVNLIVMLVSKNDIPKRCAVYWPEDRNVAQRHGSLSVTFTTSRVYNTYIERTFTLKHAKSSLPRSVTQLQYTAWPEHGLPASSHDLLSFMHIVYTFHSQQRSLQWPIIVHCENGVGHTGTFCSSYSSIQEMDAGLGIPDLPNIVQLMRKKRKFMVQEKAQLKFIHDLVYLHAVDLLQQRGVQVDTKPVIPPSPTIASHQHNIPTTFDVFGNSALSSIKASVERMNVKPEKTSEEPTKMQPLEAQSLVAKTPEQVQPAKTPEPVQPAKTPTPVQPAKTPEPVQPVPPTKPAENEPKEANISILDQLTPESFTLGAPESKDKKRITKADFYAPREGLGPKRGTDDPFGDLDPLWGLKN